MEVTDSAIIFLLIRLNVSAYKNVFFFVLFFFFIFNNNFVYIKVSVMLIVSSMWIFSLNEQQKVK